jgi:hypothetical protein
MHIADPGVPSLILPQNYINGEADCGSLELKYEKSAINVYKTIQQ